MAEAPDESTPLEIRLNELGHRLVYIVLAIALAVLVTGWLRGDDFWIMVEVSISLAVAAVPEGLPAVTTLILPWEFCAWHASGPLCAGFQPLKRSEARLSSVPTKRERSPKTG